MRADERTRGHGKDVRRNPLDDLLTDAELCAETRKARRDPFDDLPAASELSIRSRKAKVPAKAANDSVIRRLLKSTPVSVIVLIAFLMLAIGIVIGERRNGIEVVHHEVRRIPQPDLLPELATAPSALTDAELPATPIPNKSPIIEDAPPLTPQELVSKAMSSVVRVNLFNTRGEVIGHGSGFFVRDESTVVTNFHVIEWAHSANVVLVDGTSLAVLDVESLDREFDVAVLRVAHNAETKIRHLLLGPNNLPAVLSDVYLIGSPGGLDSTAVKGSVSGHRDIDGRTWIQIDASTSPGSSGSPVLNGGGLVVGVHTFAHSFGQNQKFASPATVIRDQFNANLKFQKLSELVGETRQRAFDAIRTLVKKGTAKARGTAFKELDQLSPAARDFPEYWVLTGDILQKRGEFVAAIDAFNKAVAIDTKDSATWYRIALNYELLHLNEESLKAYRKGTEVNPNDDDCWRGLGGRLRRASGGLKQQPKRVLLLEAKAAFVEAVNLQPKKSINQAGLGDILAELGDYDGAADAYKVATESSPNDWLLWFSFGNLFQQIDRHSEAVKAFEKALKLANDPVDRELIDEELRKSRRLAR